MRNTLSDHHLSLHKIILICVVGGALVGWVSTSIMSWLLSWTGKQFDGKASYDEVFRVSVYSTIPIAAALIFTVGRLVVYNVGAVETDETITADTTLLIDIALYASIFIEVSLSIFSIVLFIIGFAEIQQFSIGRSIVSLLVSIFLIFIPVIVLLLLYSVMRS